MSRAVIRLSCWFLFFVILTVLAGRACGLSSAAGGSVEIGRQIPVIRASRRVMEVPAFLAADDGINQDNSSSYCDSMKKKLRIQFSHMTFLDSLFHMFLYPVLLFSIMIRLFGRDKHVLLWRIISYMQHMRDDGEPLLPFPAGTWNCMGFHPAAMCE